MMLPVMDYIYNITPKTDVLRSGPMKWDGFTVGLT